MDAIMQDLRARVAHAVSEYWLVREKQAQRQSSAGRADQGARSSVTGGAQMDGFVSLFADVMAEAGVEQEYVFCHRAVELPGFFRPTKEWDLLVVRDDQLLAALECKSQAGPSFGNNLNNRVEEAVGSALDLWTAYRDGALNKTISPWLGYVFLLEDCPASRAPVGVMEPHFPVLPEFKGASYARRYELFCRKLVRERHYTAAACLLSQRETGPQGRFTEPAGDLTCESVVRSLLAHLAAFGKDL